MLLELYVRNLTSLSKSFDRKDQNQHSNQETQNSLTGKEQEDRTGRQIINLEETENFSQPEISETWVEDNSETKQLIMGCVMLTETVTN